MNTAEKNYAFIDSQNLVKSLEKLGWTIDWKRFRVYLKEKYNVQVAYLFIGYLPDQVLLYRALQKAGFVCCFKEVYQAPDGQVKGNIDAELVLQTMIDWEEYHQALIVTNDGDFACLVRHLKEADKLKIILATDKKNCSFLLKKSAQKQLSFLDQLEKKLSYRKRERNHKD